MTTSLKLWLGFGALTALLVLSSVAIIVRVRSIEGQVGEMANARNLSAAARQLEINTLGYALNVRAFLQTGEPQARQDAVTEAAQVERQLKEYERLATTDRQRDMAARLAPLWQELKKHGQALLDAENRPASLEDSKKLYGLRTGLEKLLDDEIQVDAVETYNARRDAAFQDVRSIVGFTLILLIFGAVIALVTSRVIGRAVVRGESELWAGREQLRITLASIGDAVITTDHEGRITYLNAVAESLTGWKHTEAAGQPLDAVFRIVNEDTRQTVENPAVRALREGIIVGLANHTLLIAKDGTERMIDDSAAPIRDEWDKVSGAVLIFRDITASRLADESLLEAGALQSAIFNSANFSSIATDANGVIQIFNVGAERMLGYTAADVMNKITPAEISDPEEVILRAKTLSAELGTPITPGFEALAFKASRGIEDIYELTYIRKDGTRFPAVVSVTALRDAENKIIGYLLIGTDNTARKEVEAEQKLLDQRLRDQQFYTRSLIESNIDALMTTNPSGIITDVNKQMEALTGCTRDELIGAPFKSYFTDPERAEAGINLVLSEKKVTNYELTARARDGKETVVSYNATTFYDRDRKLQGVFAAARDVTERKRFELALQESNAGLESATSLAERANLAKSEFLSSMSHELRSPLNGILGFAQLMESDSPPPSATQKESIAQILQAGWHLLKLIDEILDLAKVESGQVPLSPEPISMAEVMLECQTMVESQARQRGVKLSFPRFDTAHFVRADRTRVKQVLINLLTNAIKYNRPKGTVVVECDPCTPERTRISVRDTGAGLHPEELAQLFRAFNRLGQEAGGEEGTGIGLVLAKRLVELMGGTIGVESTVGVGSVFWFELTSVAEPHLTTEDCPSEVAQPRVARAARQHTLLYVEDNPANMKLVQQIIARHPDISLLTAVNGKTGIEIARASHPDVILMDINLPGMSGFDALKRLRSDPATADIPVIAISANAMPLDIKRGMGAGFFRYLTKPIKVNEFMEALDVALEFAGQNSGQSK